MKESLARLKRHALDLIGEVEVTRIRFADINSVLDGCKKKDLGKSSVTHVFQDLHTVFNALSGRLCSRLLPSGDGSGLGDGGERSLVS